MRKLADVLAEAITDAMTPPNPKEIIEALSTHAADIETRDMIYTISRFKTSCPACVLSTSIEVIAGQLWAMRFSEQADLDEVFKRIKEKIDAIEAATKKTVQ